MNESMFAPLQMSLSSGELDGGQSMRSDDGNAAEPSLVRRTRAICQRSTIPLKIVIHILLLIAATAQLLVDNGESDYLRGARRSWYKFFFPPEYDELEDYAPTRPHYLYTADDVVAAMRHSLVGYETIVDRSLDTLAYYPPHTPQDEMKEERKPALLTMKRYVSPYVFDPDKNFDPSTEVDIIEVNSTNLGPFEDSKARVALLRRVVDMSLTFSLVSIEMASLRRVCLVWRFEVGFSFKSRGQVHMTLNDAVLRDCDDTTSSDELFDAEDMLWMNLVLVLLSTLYFIAIVRHVTRKFNAENAGFFGQMYENTTAVRMRVLTVSMIRRIGAYLDFWIAFDLICLTCISVSSVMNIANNAARKPTASFHMAMIGLGNALLWITLVQYFSHNKTYFALILTLERAVPKVFKFLLGVAPIFMGYSVFGVAYFGAKTLRFAGIMNSFVSLFSLLNGDAVSDTFHDLIPLGSFIAQAYLYSFIMIWTYVVLNVLIAIVEESFFTSIWNSSQQHQEQNGFADTVERGENSNKWFRANRIPTYRSVSVDEGPYHVANDIGGLDIDGNGVLAPPPLGSEGTRALSSSLLEGASLTEHQPIIGSG